MSWRKLLRRALLVESLETRTVFNATIWVDPISGNDQNDGQSPGKALRTLERVVSQYEALKPANHIPLQAGDTLTLMPGEHDFAYRYGEGQWQGLFLRNVHGTNDQPITIRGLPGAKLDNRAPDGSEMSSIYLLQSSHIVVEGLEVSSYGSAVSVADAHDIVIRDNYIHDVDGVAANNLSGIYLTGVRDVVVERNFLVDNFDRSQPGNANNRHVVLFGAVDVKILNNTMVNSQPTSGMAVDYKHLGGTPVDLLGSYEVAYNTIINAAGTAIGTSAPNSHIHHNLLIDSGSIRVTDLGGTAQLANELIEYNTLVNTFAHTDGGGLSYYPSEYPGYPLGSLQWAHNLVVDARPYDHAERSTITVDRYGSDEFYSRAILGGLLRADGNLYQTREPARFDIYGANGGSYGALGGMWSFAQWQAAGLDRSGATSSVAIDDYFRDLSASGVPAGIYAGDSAKLTAILVNRDLNESGSQSKTTLRLVRSGSDLSSPLQVSLKVSQSGQIDLPQSALFEAGVDAIEIEVTGVADQRFETSTAIQIRAEAEGMLTANTWVRLHDSPAEETCPQAEEPVPVVSLPIFDPPRMVICPPYSEPQLVEGVFQVPGDAGQSMVLQSSVQKRLAAYNNEMGIAYVDDAAGTVNGLSPTDPGWSRALLSRNQHEVVLRAGAVAGDTGQVSVTAGRFIVFYLVQNDSTANWQATNPDNQLNGSSLLFTSVSPGNPDLYDHVREQLTAVGIDLAWEDLTFGGDQSFLDLVVSTQFVADEQFYCPVDENFPVPPDEPLLHLPQLPTWPGWSWSVDVNQDGQLTPLDVLLVVVAWLDGQEIDGWRFLVDSHLLAAE